MHFPRLAWILLGLLLVHSSSFPWMALLIVQEELLRGLFVKIHLPPDALVFVFSVFGMSGYFQQVCLALATNTIFSSDFSLVYCRLLPFSSSFTSVVQCSIFVSNSYTKKTVLVYTTSVHCSYSKTAFVNGTGGKFQCSPNPDFIFELFYAGKFK